MRRACPSSRAARARAFRAARCRSAQGVVLSLAKFRRILAIDPLARTAVVQPGVRNLAISEAAAPHGLFYAPDPSSQIACSIGGNVAENAGGVHCLKYGLTVHNVRKRARRARSPARSSSSAAMRSTAPGYDLLALITGSEGLLAVITRDHGEAAAEAAARAGRARGIRRPREGGRGGRRDHRRRHHSRRARDDGPGSDARGRAVRARRLSARRRGGAAGRSRRHARRSGRGNGGDHRAC